MISQTGATGRVGSAAAKALARANITFRVVVRDPEKVAFGPGTAEIVQGDRNGPAIVEQALQGVSRAFIYWSVRPPTRRKARRRSAKSSGNLLSRHGSPMPFVNFLPRSPRGRWKNRPLPQQISWAVRRWTWKLPRSNLRVRLRLLASSSLFAMWMEPH